MEDGRWSVNFEDITSRVVDTSTAASFAAFLFRKFEDNSSPTFTTFQSFELHFFKAKINSHFILNAPYLVHTK